MSRLDYLWSTATFYIFSVIDFRLIEKRRFFAEMSKWNWNFSQTQNGICRIAEIAHGNRLRQVFQRNIRLLGFAFSCWPKHVQWLAHSQRLETTGPGKNQRCLGINSPECTCECQFDWCDRWIGEKSFVTFPTLIIVENIDQLKIIRYSSNSTWIYIYSKIRCRLTIRSERASSIIQGLVRWWLIGSLIVIYN